MPVTTSKSKNSFGIPFFTQGPPILITRLNAILAALDSLRPVISADIAPTITTHGTLLTLRNPSPATTRARTALGPFTIYAASTTSGGTTTLKLSVIPGTVNLVVPTLAGTALDATTPPTLTITATTYLWLKCVGTFGSPDTYVATVESNTTGTLPSGTAITPTGFTSYLYLGKATVAGSAVTAIEPYNYGNNWNVESLGSVNIWFK